jgi:hypothetical protein
MSKAYRKFSSRFAARDWDKPKTFAGFATFAEGGQDFEAPLDAIKVNTNTPKNQTVPLKVVQVAKVAEPSLAYRAASAEPDGTGCAVEIVELPAADLAVGGPRGNRAHRSHSVNPKSPHRQRNYRKPALGPLGDFG